MSCRFSAQRDERSRIEETNRRFDLLLSKIRKDRVQLAVQVAEYSLFRQALVRRRYIPTVRLGDLARRDQQNVFPDHCR